MYSLFKPYEGMDEKQLAEFKDPIIIEGEGYKYVLTPLQMPEMMKRFKTLANTEGKPTSIPSGNPNWYNKRSKWLQTEYVRLKAMTESERAKLRKSLAKQKGTDWRSAIDIENADRIYLIDLLTPKIMKPKEEKKVQAKVFVIDYSEKSIVVFGDTKPIKDKLKEHHCKFNPFLTIDGKKQAGWVASKKHESEVKQLIETL